MKVQANDYGLPILLNQSLEVSPKYAVAIDGDFRYDWMIVACSYPTSVIDNRSLRLVKPVCSLTILCDKQGIIEQYFTDWANNNFEQSTGADNRLRNLRTVTIYRDRFQNLPDANKQKIGLYSMEGYPEMDTGWASGKTTPKTITVTIKIP